MDIYSPYSCYQTKLGQLFYACGKANLQTAGCGERKCSVYCRVPSKASISFLLVSLLILGDGWRSFSVVVGTKCNLAGPYGTFQGRPFPHILCFSSTLKYLDNRIRCTFPELFYRCEISHQMQDDNYLMTMTA